MTCPVCGKASSCVHRRQNSSVLVDPVLVDHGAVAVDPPGSSGSISAAPGRSSTSGPPDSQWRREVASRVRQHRARRRKPDANALELAFPADASHSFGPGPEDRPSSPPPDRFAQILVKPETPKIIRFPRSMPAHTPAVEEVPLEELAQPVPEALRIVEATSLPQPDAASADDRRRQDRAGQLAACDSFRDPMEQMELLPTFADIRLEPEEERLDSELDLIPRPAPLSQRFVSGLIDAGIVVIATGVCAFTFLELAEEMPQTRLTLEFVMAAAGIFWLVFQ